MITFDQFIDKFTDIQRDVMRDHAAEDGEHISPLCHILHRDIQLAETPAEDADEVAEGLTAKLGEPISGLDLDFTVEHRQLHALLRQVQMETVVSGGSASELLAAMFVIGRRYGMREAADAFGSLSDADPAGDPR